MLSGHFFFFLLFAFPPFYTVFELFRRLDFGSLCEGVNDLPSGTRLLFGVCLYIR